MIFPDPDSQIIGATVAEDVAFGPENLGLPPQAIRDRVRDALRAVSLEKSHDSATHLLSDTEKFRLALAGALALEPECLLVDRATAQLDPAGRKEAGELLHSLNRDRGLTVIQLTDDPEEAASADRIVVCAGGKIVLDGTSAQVLPALQQRAEGEDSLPPDEIVGAAGAEPEISAGASPVSALQSLKCSAPEAARGRATLLKEMTALNYLPGDSILHRSDPRTKIVLTLCFMGAVFLFKSFPALLLLLAIMLALASSAGKSLKRSLRGLKLVLYLTGVAVAVNLVTIKGTPLLDHGLLRHVSLEAVATSAAMLLRVVLLASAASLLTLSTTPFALAEGVERLLKPLKRIGVPVSEIAMMLLIALRFLPLIVEEAQRLILAQPAGSGEAGRVNLVQRARSYLPLFLPLFAGVARRGDALAVAMEARCYRGGTGRTRMNPLQFCRADLACSAATVLILTLVVLLEKL